MAYTPTWNNGTAGRVVSAEHYVQETDAAELIEAVNRRRRLVYLDDRDYSGEHGQGTTVRARLIGGHEQAYHGLRAALVEEVITPACGRWNYDPPTPLSMEWLWPLADDDEGKVIVTAEPGAGQVNIFQRLSEGSTWVGDVLAGRYIEAGHVNELRQALEWLRRGRWRLPVYPSGGLLSLMPNDPWIGSTLGNNGSDELRSGGPVLVRDPAQPLLGLAGVTVADAWLDIWTDVTCHVAAYRILRAMDFEFDRPTWNQYGPARNLSWQQPGGLGAQDSVYIGEILVPANTTVRLQGAGLVEAVQAVVDGAEQGLLFRRYDVGYEAIAFTALLGVEFDLATPPN